ncbi:MAG: hypothetical protein U1E54_04280 [Candidatus Levybacteria bacterium]|nr:hypothetical protein [Candidatus Levybacteria bacterium]
MINDSFEERLPSLVECWKPAGSFPKDFIVVPVLEVSRNCIDKQKIREARYTLVSMINQCLLFNEIDKNILNQIEEYFEEFDKELGLK